MLKLSKHPNYCWWKKSITTWDVSNPVNNKDTRPTNWCRISSTNSSWTNPFEKICNRQIGELSSPVFGVKIQNLKPPPPPSKAQLVVPLTFAKCAAGPTKHLGHLAHLDAWLCTILRWFDSTLQWNINQDVTIKIHNLKSYFMEKDDFQPFHICWTSDFPTWSSGSSFYTP